MRDDTTADHTHLSDQDVERIIGRMIEAIEAGNSEAAADAIEFTTCGRNVGAFTFGLAWTTGMTMRQLVADEHPHGEVFARPNFSPDTPESAWWAGRMIAVAVNDDADTLGALVNAWLGRVEQIPDDDAAAAFSSDVMFHIIAALRAVLHERDTV